MRLASKPWMKLGLLCLLIILFVVFRKFNKKTEGFNTVVRTISIYAGTGTAVNNGNEDNLRSIPMGGGNGMCVDSIGNIYVSCVTFIRKIYTSGYSQIFAGDYTISSDDRDGIGKAARFKYIIGMVIDRSNNIFVSDVTSHKIKKITPTGVVTTFAGSGINGTGSQSSDNNTNGLLAKLSNPNAMTIDSLNNIYVCQSSLTVIRKITPTGAVSSIQLYSNNSTGNMWNNSMCADSLNNIYLTGLRKIIKLQPNGAVTVLAGNASGTSWADGSASAARFSDTIAGMVNDTSSDYIYVSDTFNRRIRMVDKNTGQTTTIAGNGTAGNTFTGNTLNNLACLMQPRGITKINNRIYVFDSGYGTIKVIEEVITCGVGKYVSGSICESCPAGTSQNSATFTGTSCTTCPAGTYSASTGATFCTGCLTTGGATSVTSPPGSTSSSACRARLCNTGHYLNGTVCTSCPAGTSQNIFEFGGSSCTTCAVGTYSSAGATTCTTCSMPAGASATTSPAGSTSQAACTATSCYGGHYLNGTVCTSCPAGKFQNTGNFTGSSCTNCAVGTYSSAGAISCTSCGSTKYTIGLGSTSSGACLTLPRNAVINSAGGYTCATGYYNNGTTCVALPANSDRNSSGTDYICRAGYSKTATGCAACSQGTFSAAGATSCSTCAAGTYSGPAASVCLNLPTGTVASTSGSGYSCAPEFYNNGSNCVPLPSNASQSSTGTGFSCFAGYSKSASGTSCTQCGVGTYSSAGATSCTSCGSTKYTTGLGSTSLAACITLPPNAIINSAGGYTCAAGYYNNGTTCVALPANSDRNSSGTGYICRAGFYNNGSNCVALPAGAGQNSIGTGFTCSAGYSQNATGCTQCGQGTFSAAGATSCSACAAGTYSGPGASVCLTLPPGAVASTSGSGYSCAPGFYNNGSNCVPLPSNAGQNSAGIGFRCFAGYSQNATGCTECGGGTYSSAGETTCTSCGTGKYTIRTGSSNSQACLSLPSNATLNSAGGYTCQTGFYNNGSNCVALPANATQSSSGTGFTCGAGYSQGLTTCTQCGAGTFSAAGATSCSVCGTGTYSRPGASSCENPPPNAIANPTGTGFTCQTGYYNNGSNCVGLPPNADPSDSGTGYTCKTGFYKTETGCVALPSNALARTTGTGFLCVAGYSENESGTSCTQCGVGTYSSTGATSCTQCGAGKYTIGPGSSNAQACLTLPASATPNSSGGYTCGPGLYNNGSNCVALPSNASQSSSGTGFTCSAGYSQGLTTCTQCGAGTFSAAGATSCSNCGAGTYSRPGASSCENPPPNAIANPTGTGYTCGPGYYNNGSNCVGLPPNADPSDSGTGYTCKTGFYKTETGCVALPSNALARTTGTGFLCVAGYSENESGTSCTQCGVGTYSSTGATSCTSCGAGKYTTGPGSSNAQACLTVPADATLNSSGTGYTCGPGLYNNGSNCVALPSNASQSSSGTGFTCSAGYSQGLTTCTQCGAGTFSAAGATSCSVCGTGTYSRPGSSSCDNPPPNAIANPTGTGYLCQPGYYNNGSNCVGLPPNSGQSSSGTGFTCDAGYSQGLTTCTQCGIGSFSAAGATTCTQCGAGKYTIGPGASSCLTVPADATLNSSGTGYTCGPGLYNNGSNCVALPSNANPSSSGTGFTCDAGYSQGLTTCTQCGAGTFSAAGQTSCSNCGAGTYSGPGASFCESPPPNAIANPTGTGYLCETGFYRTETGCVAIPTNAKINDLGTGFICDAGYSQDNTSCSRCGIGTYSGPGQTSCTSCEDRPGSIGMTTSMGGSTSSSNCIASSCTPGYGFSAGNCTQCGSGFFGTGGTTQCVACSVGKTSPVGSSNSSQCVCPPGQLSVTVGGISRCVNNCANNSLPPKSQGSIDGILSAIKTCVPDGTNTYNYVIGSNITTTNPCTGPTFYDFDRQVCVNALGAVVDASSSYTCDNNSVYSEETNACVPVRVIVKPGDPKLRGTKGQPGPNDYRECKTVDQGDCSLLFNNGSGTYTPNNPCLASGKVYNFATDSCESSSDSCCRFTNAAAAAAGGCVRSTRQVLTKNPAKCPTGSRALCCNQASLTNRSCRDQGFWSNTYQFTPEHNRACTSGFANYGSGIDSIAQKRVKRIFIKA